MIYILYETDGETFDPICASLSTDSLMQKVENDLAKNHPIKWETLDEEHSAYIGDEDVPAFMIREIETV